MRASLIILLVAAASWPALAEDPHHHPPQDEAVHDRFYRTWMRPDQPSMSCCNKQDCYPTDIKLIGEDIYARRRGYEEYIFVPPEKVERNRDNPDGRNHVCMSPGGVVYCFTLGTGM